MLTSRASNDSTNLVPHDPARCCVYPKRQDLSSCEELAAADLVVCVTEVPKRFVEDCNERPDTATKVAESACAASEKADGWIGWIKEGERCFNFNGECIGDLMCRPIRCSETVPVCKPATPWGACDESCYSFDFECSGGLVCRPPTNDDDAKQCLPESEIGYCTRDSDWRTLDGGFSWDGLTGTINVVTYD